MLAALIASLCLLNVPLVVGAEEPHCIWYGQSHMEGIHWLNRATNITAQPLTDESAEAIYKRRCPTWYAEYKAADPDGKIP